MLTENHKLNINEFEDTFYQSLANHGHFKFTYTHDDSTLIIIDMYNNILTRQHCSFTYEELVELTKKIQLKKMFLETRNGASIKTEPKDRNKPLGFAKNSSYASSRFARGANMSEDMWAFIFAAYEAGMNITVNGPAGSGKTIFMRYLYNNTNGAQRTMVGDTSGNNSATAVQNDIRGNVFMNSTLDFFATTAYRIRAERVVLDKHYSNTSEFLDFLPIFRNNGISVLTSLTTDSTNSAKRFALLEYMDIEVNVENRNGNYAVVESINQIVKANGGVIQRLLWNSKHQRVAEPSRKLRRDIADNSLKAYQIESLQKSNHETFALKSFSSSKDKELKRSHDIINTYIQAAENVPQDVQHAMEAFDKYVKNI